MQELMERVEEICPAHAPQQDTEQLKVVKQKQHLVNSSPGAVRGLAKPLGFTDSQQDKAV